MTNKMVINRPKPIAEQAKQILQDRIRNRHYGPRGRLPSEAQLSSSLGVSRATIRTALAALAAEGLIVRKQGDGTYVSKRAIEIMSYTGWDFSQLIMDSGRKVTIRVLEAVHRLATADEANILKIHPNDEVLSLYRIFMADESPAILSTNTLSAALVKEPYPPNAFKESIFDFLEIYCRQIYAYNVVDISLTRIDTEIATIAGLKANDPIIKMDEVFYNSEDLPLFCATNYFNDQVIRLRFLRTKTETSLCHNADETGRISRSFS